MEAPVYLQLAGRTLHTKVVHWIEFGLDNDCDYTNPCHSRDYVGSAVNDSANSYEFHLEDNDGSGRNWKRREESTAAQALLGYLGRHMVDLLPVALVGESVAGHETHLRTGTLSR
jgi:hypothetical protein